jgi:hypothetical protein
LQIPPELNPHVLVSSTLRKGIKDLRDRIKRESKMVIKKKKEGEKGRVGIGK